MSRWLKLLLVSIAINRAVFSWSWDGTAGAGVWFQFLCGAGLVGPQIPSTARSLPVASVISDAGEYSCTLAAYNEFGSSLPSAPVEFKAGHPPPHPGDLRIITR